jgi:hypothetical protein
MEATGRVPHGYHPGLNPGLSGHKQASNCLSRVHGKAMRGNTSLSEPSGKEHRDKMADKQAS